MAIGVTSKVHHGPSGQMALSYEGKRPAATVLAATPVRHETVWSNGAGKSDNRLFFGNNSDVLLSLRKDPDVHKKVKLVYIDPPFATKTTFQTRQQNDAYHDSLGGAEFIEYLRERLILLHDLLSDDGSLYLHLDDKMVFAAKTILDEVFGQYGFRNCIVRKKCNPKNYTRNAFGNVADFILFYTKSDTYTWTRQYEEWTEDRAKEYRYADADGRRYMKVPVHAPGTRNGETGGLWRGKLPPPGKHWQYTPSTLDEMDARGEIYWSPNGNPRRKVYLETSNGVPVQDIWTGFRDAHNQNIQITGYPTEKNPNLLRRIISASSAPGDLVLDCFSGSGTTLAVAAELGRRWIGVDSSPQAIRATLKRFSVGLETMGDFVGTRKSVGADSDPHVPVDNFDILAEPGLMKQASGIVSEWTTIHAPHVDIGSRSAVAKNVRIRRRHLPVQVTFPGYAIAP